MKRLLLITPLLLGSLASQAQTTRTFTGALTLTDPAIPGDRLLRDGATAACGTTKTYPGISNLGATGVRYDTYTVGNTSTTATNCLTITLTPNCTDATGNPLFVSVYTGSFNPANLATNYKSDIGGSPAVGSAGTLGVTLSANETVVIVVSGVTSTSVCNAYSLTVAAPITLPTKASQDANAALRAYPNPVADVLHIEAAKPGTYTLYNATGQAVKEIKNTDTPLGDLPGGVYLLRQAETGITTRITKL